MTFNISAAFAKAADCCSHSDIYNSGKYDRDRSPVRLTIQIFSELQGKKKPLRRGAVKA